MRIVIWRGGWERIGEGGRGAGVMVVDKAILGRPYTEGVPFAGRQ